MFNQEIVKIRVYRHILKTSSIRARLEVVMGGEAVGCRTDFRAGKSTVQSVEYVVGTIRIWRVGYVAFAPFEERFKYRPLD